MRAPRVLAVDDQPQVLRLVAAAAAGRGLRCDTAASLAEAGGRLRAAAYDILVLDVNLPDGSGLSLAARGLGDPLAIVMTGGLGMDTAVEAIRRGAVDVVAKPFSLRELDACLGRVEERWRARERVAGAERVLEELADRRSAELERFARRAADDRAATVAALGAALGLRDRETGGHCLRVAENCVRLARRLGVSEGALGDLRWGAYLHDVGKIGVSDRILAKPSALDPGERAQMQQHPSLGVRLLSPLPFLQRAAEVVGCHHERFDGRGYPAGLRGEGIPLAARIFSVVDTLDAITSDRPYRAAQPYGACAREVERGAGGQFDPVVACAFLDAGPSTWLAADGGGQLPR